MSNGEMHLYVRTCGQHICCLLLMRTSRCSRARFHATVWRVLFRGLHQSMSRLVHDLQSCRPAAATVSSSSLMSAQLHETLTTISHQLNELEPMSTPCRYLTPHWQLHSSPDRYIAPRRYLIQTADRFHYSLIGRYCQQLLFTLFTLVLRGIGISLQIEREQFLISYSVNICFFEFFLWNLPFKMLIIICMVCINK